MLSNQKETKKTLLPDLTNHPSYLWIGDEATLVAQTIKALQIVLCPNNSCGTCIPCKQVIERQNSNLLWLCPEKNYTLDLIEPVFKTTAFALEHEQHYFIVLQKADFFNQACANALLKLLEEPPTGYHFILLAERSEYILPTIRSRCLINHFARAQAPEEVHQIESWFKNWNFPNPASACIILDKAHLSERDSLQLLDQLLTHWTEQNIQAVLENDARKQKQTNLIITLLKNALEKPPMPGSSKIFWKDLFLQCTVSYP